MKKIILSLCMGSVLCLFPNCTATDKSEDGSVLVEIPDANFKTYLLEKFDKNKDGDISRAEARAANNINCSGLTIESLTGIEYFRNIKSLDCSDNQLEEIDLRYNRKLNKLNCKGNKSPLNVYFGMTSPLRNPKVQKPESNKTPDIQGTQVTIDKSKCTWDGDTRFILYFNY